EVPLDVDLADRVDQGAAGRGDRAALARALLLRAGGPPGEEGEATVVPGQGQPRGHAAGGVEGEPVLPDLERLAGDERGDAAQGFGMPGDDPLLAAEPGGVEEGVPFDAGRARGDIGAGPGLDAVGV